MASRRRGYRSRRLQAFHDDPQLLIIGPAPPSAGLNDLKPFNLSTVLMAVHKHCYTSLNPTQQGGPRRRETSSPTPKTHITPSSMSISLATSDIQSSSSPRSFATRLIVVT